MAALQTNHTIYVKNLNPRIKDDSLRRALYLQFSRTGEVIEISLRKGVQYRGQAWVVFKEVHHAVQTIKMFNNTLFFGRPLSLSFSVNKSDVVAKADGTYVPPQLRTLTKAIEQDNQHMDDEVEPTTSRKRRRPGDDEDNDDKDKDPEFPSPPRHIISPEHVHPLT